jgi:hypothetical protein
MADTGNSSSGSGKDIVAFSQTTLTSIAAYKGAINSAAANTACVSDSEAIV